MALEKYILQNHGNLNLYKKQNTEREDDEAKRNLDIYENAASKSKNKLGFIALLIALIMIGGIGWSIYYFIFKKENNIVTDNNIISDTTVQKQQPALADSAVIRPGNSCCH